jgi:hypothetical protein
MQIQRLQSLLLFFAAVLMGAVNFLPLAVNQDGTQLLTTQSPVLLIINVLVTVLLLVVIFMYKNLRQQMQITLLTIVLMVIFAAIAGEVISSSFASIVWTGALPVYVLSVVLAIWARCRMSHDLHLLRSADRLR